VRAFVNSYYSNIIIIPVLNRHYKLNNILMISCFYLKEDHLEYCKLDTPGIVRIVERLREIISS
jgi:hypothetical protein